MTEEKNLGENFRIISELSSGGFGQTFLGEDLRSSNRPQCVIKHLNPTI
jgi:eukaryotic-like serine/threonine-protein kinase